MDLAALGSQILQELNKFNEMPQRSLESYIQGISLTFSGDFPKSIDNVCRIITPTEISKYRTTLGPTPVQQPQEAKLQLDIRGSLGLNPINSNKQGTPKFDQFNNRFSILSDDEDINFDPTKLPDLNVPSTESKKPSNLQENKENGTNNSHPQSSPKFVRESFGVGFETPSTGPAKNERIDDPVIQKIGQSQSAKQFSPLSNYETAPSKLYIDTSDPKKKLNSFLNVSPKNGPRASTAIHNKSARDASTPSPKHQRSTLVSKNKSALDLTVSTEKGKKPGSGSFQQIATEEISKAKSVSSSASFAKASLSAKKTFMVNPKFESMVNGLRNETLETVDLTGAGNNASYNFTLISVLITRTR